MFKLAAGSRGPQSLFNNIGVCDTYQFDDYYCQYPLSVMLFIVARVSRLEFGVVLVVLFPLVHVCFRVLPYFPS